MVTHETCNKNHSGNKSLHQTAGGWLQCAGCGAFYGTAPMPKTTQEMILPQPRPIPQPAVGKKD